MDADVKPGLMKAKSRREPRKGSDRKEKNLKGMTGSSGKLSVETSGFRRNGAIASQPVHSQTQCRRVGESPSGSVRSGGRPASKLHSFAGATARRRKDILDHETGSIPSTGPGRCPEVESVDQEGEAARDSKKWCANAVRKRISTEDGGRLPQTQLNAHNGSRVDAASQFLGTNFVQRQNPPLSDPSNADSLLNQYPASTATLRSTLTVAGTDELDYDLKWSIQSASVDKTYDVDVQSARQRPSLTTKNKQRLSAVPSVDSASVKLRVPPDSIRVPLAGEAVSGQNSLEVEISMTNGRNRKKGDEKTGMKSIILAMDSIIQRLLQRRFRREALGKSGPIGAEAKDVRTSRSGTYDADSVDRRALKMPEAAGKGTSDFLASATAGFESPSSYDSQMNGTGSQSMHVGASNMADGCVAQAAVRTSSPSPVPAAALRAWKRNIPLAALVEPEVQRLGTSVASVTGTGHMLSRACPMEVAHTKETAVLPNAAPCQGSVEMPQESLKMTTSTQCPKNAHVSSRRRRTVTRKRSSGVDPRGCLERTFSTKDRLVSEIMQYEDMGQKPLPLRCAYIRNHTRKNKGDGFSREVWSDRTTAEGSSAMCTQKMKQDGSILQAKPVGRGQEEANGGRREPPDTALKGDSTQKRGNGGKPVLSRTRETSPKRKSNRVSSAAEQGTSAAGGDFSGAGRKGDKSGGRLAGQSKSRPGITKSPCDPETGDIAWKTGDRPEASVHELVWPTQDVLQGEWEDIKDQISVPLPRRQSVVRIATDAITHKEGKEPGVRPRRLKKERRNDDSFSPPVEEGDDEPFTGHVLGAPTLNTTEGEGVKKYSPEVKVDLSSNHANQHAGRNKDESMEEGRNLDAYIPNGNIALNTGGRPETWNEQSPVHVSPALVMKGSPSIDVAKNMTKRNTGITDGGLNNAPKVPGTKSSTTERHSSPTPPTKGAETTAKMKEKPKTAPGVGGTARVTTEASPPKSSGVSPSSESGKVSASTERTGSQSSGMISLARSASPLESSPVTPVSQYVEPWAQPWAQPWMQPPLSPVLTQGVGMKAEDVEEGDPYVLLFICALCCCLLFVFAVTLFIIFRELHVFYEPRTTTTIATGTTTTASVFSRPVTTTDNIGLTVYYCSTTFCSREGQYIKSLLSNTTRPCDNFYGHVCDTWSRYHPHDASGVGSVVSPDTHLESKIAKDILPFLLHATQNDMRLARQLFRDCADRSKVGTSITTVREIFRQWAIGDWPRTSANSSVSEVWQFAGELVRDFDISGIISVKVGVNPDTLYYRIIELSEPELIFFRGDETQQKLVSLFRSAVMEIATELGIDVITRTNLASDVLKGFKEMAYAVHGTDIKGDAPGPPSIDVYRLDGGVHELLNVIFKNVFEVGFTTSVVLKSPNYVQDSLPRAIRHLPPGSALNYLGFLALIRMAPFLPERLRDLRQLYSKSVIGRASEEVTDTRGLCLRIVDKILPYCLSKAHAQFRANSGVDVTAQEWMSQLVTVFGQQISYLHWIDELSALLIRYRIKHWHLVRLPPNTDAEMCSPTYPNRPTSPLRFYHSLSVLRRQQEIQEINRQGDPKLWRLPQSSFGTQATYDPSRHVVYVPEGVINSTVPGSSTLFAFHLARVAVRLYRALAEVLLDDNIYMGEAPLRFTEESHRRLSVLMDCFERDIRNFPLALGPVAVTMDAASARRAALVQTVAVHMAFRAFRELMHARRIWKLDFRLWELKNISADQLFFIYFALDNCESGDNVYRISRARLSLPAEDMVNVPLRHMKEFTKLFACDGSSGMAVPAASTCEVGWPVQV